MEQGASASRMTTTKNLDVISRLPTFSGQAIGFFAQSSSTAQIPEWSRSWCSIFRDPIVEAHADRCLSDRICGCGRHHRAACGLTGALGRRGSHSRVRPRASAEKVVPEWCPTCWSAARIWKFLWLPMPDVWRWSLMGCHCVQFAVDTTLLSALLSDGSPRRGWCGIDRGTEVQGEDLPQICWSWLLSTFGGSGRGSRTRWSAKAIDFGAAVAMDRSPSLCGCALLRCFLVGLHGGRGADGFVPTSLQA